MAAWICWICGNEVMTIGEVRPTQLPWSDGHKCQMLRLDKLDNEDRGKLIKAIEERL